MRKLSMHKISEVLRQRFELHRSYRDISRSLNISVGTISDYIARAKAAGLSWPLPKSLSEEELYQLLFLPSDQAKRNRVQPDWAYIAKELRKKGVALQLLWREYRQQHREGIGYLMFCHYYQRYAKTLNPIMRLLNSR